MPPPPLLAQPSTEVLCDRTDHVVNEYDIDKITMWLQDFGDDNRACIDVQLHRVSAICNNMNKIIGLTIRVGRYIEGNSDMIRDLLEEGNKSILILGEPGSVLGGDV
jgi:stage III sporulation protein SpoIIIAA